jgi:hypothetical protein
VIAYSLPTDPRERVIFCFAYGDAFDGDHEKALAAARFAVMYSVGMGSTAAMGLKLDGRSDVYPDTPEPL